ncbi:hypothetical protein [Nostoc sp. TCL26-01]|uniref:hypothetical protein n=1 Tax=Nostoc sp. TCL26-01 TaxID=2576904 RepID=UPI0015BA05E3|nr:hypothetical protein [Nostoc sp. TCL26-01]QLE56607.1 hypothetical protein FD725_14480 [Nostoc sp. TCL26-01]
MKFHSASVGIGLSVVSNLFLVNSLSIPLFNSSQVLAQEVATLCPLPADIAVTFLDSKCEAVKLNQPKTFYRYYSSDQNKYGRYLTTDKYKNNVDVIRNLALNQAWGNKATIRLKVTLPAGTTVYQGIVAPQTPAQCYPGGGQQTFIQDSKDPNIKWSQGKNITVQEFVCPQN